MSWISREVDTDDRRPKSVRRRLFYPALGSDFGRSSNHESLYDTSFADFHLSTEHNVLKHKRDATRSFNVFESQTKVGERKK